MFTTVIQDRAGLTFSREISDDKMQSFLQDTGAWDPGLIVAIVRSGTAVTVDTMGPRFIYRVLLRRGGDVDVENASGWSGLEGDLVHFYREAEVIATFEREAVAGVIALPADG